MGELITRTVKVHNTSAAPEERIRLDECFAPAFVTQKKIRGEFVQVERLLMPGYLVAVTDNPVALAGLLRGIREFSRLLSAGDEYVPLAGMERTWLEEATSKYGRLLPMSFGYKVGDVLTVTKGPLQGYEALVRKVDRANSLAHVEVHVGPITIRTTVGLGILPGEPPEA